MKAKKRERNIVHGTIFGIAEFSVSFYKEQGAET